MTNQNRLTTYNHQHGHSHEEEDEQYLEIPLARIFDADYCGESVSEGFDAVKITLDGKIKADLSWKEACSAARAYCAQGFRIFWEMDLGLPDKMAHPLSNRTQFMALSLSLEHFCNTLWKEFRKETVGLCLYRGSLDFTKNFCLDEVGEYLNLLASGVTDQLPLYLLFDVGSEDPFVIAQLLSQERYPRFNIGVRYKSALKPSQNLGGVLAWDGIPMEKGMISRNVKSAERKKAPLGLCLPKMSQCHSSNMGSIRLILEDLLKKGLPFRVIPEVDLAVEWDGLDYLIVDDRLVDVQFKRRLHGFCAAGGTVVFLDKSLGLPHETLYSTFMSDK